MKEYRKTGTQAMEPWHEGYDMKFVSVSEVDVAEGSPKEGDMIAVNVKNPEDRWLICQKFFLENYEEV